MTGVYECFSCHCEFEAELELEENDDTVECPGCCSYGELKYIEKS